MVRRTTNLRVLRVLDRLVTNVLKGSSRSVDLGSVARRVVHQYIMTAIRIDTDDSYFDEWNEASDARPDWFNVTVDNTSELKPGMIVCIRDSLYGDMERFVQILKCYEEDELILFYEYGGDKVAELDRFNSHNTYVSNPPMWRKFAMKEFTEYRQSGVNYSLYDWQ